MTGGPIPWTFAKIPDSLCCAHNWPACRLLPTPIRFLGKGSLSLRFRLFPQWFSFLYTRGSICLDGRSALLSASQARTSCRVLLASCSATASFKYFCSTIVVVPARSNSIETVPPKTVAFSAPNVVLRGPLHDSVLNPPSSECWKFSQPHHPRTRTKTAQSVFWTTTTRPDQSRTFRASRLRAPVRIACASNS